MIDVGTLYEQYAGELRAFAAKQLPNDADDIVSQVFVDVLRNAPAYEDRGYVRAWLYRITRSRIIDQQRKYARKPEQHLGEQAIETKSDGFVIEGVELLPLQYEALRLHLDGYSVKEIAAKTGRSYRSVVGFLSCAKRRLRVARGTAIVPRPEKPAEPAALPISFHRHSWAPLCACGAAQYCATCTAGKGTIPCKECMCRG